MMWWGLDNMLGNMMKNLTCPVCLAGDLEYSQAETFKAFNDIFELEDVEAIVDGVIEQFVVFICLNCDATSRFRFREIEKIVRRDLSTRVMTLKATGELGRALTIKNRYYIYCGHCTGFDGRGSCPKTIYENCDIKKVPNVI